MAQKHSSGIALVNSTGGQKELRVFQKLKRKTNVVVKRGGWREFQELNHTRALWVTVRAWIWF